MGPLSIILNDISKVHTPEWCEAYSKREAQINQSNSIYLLEQHRRALQIKRDIVQKTVADLDAEISSLIAQIVDIKLSY